MTWNDRLSFNGSTILMLSWLSFRQSSFAAIIFLCGLFFPIEQLPVFLRPISYLFPLIYGVDILHRAFQGEHLMPLSTDFIALSLFCIALFLISLRNIGRRWIL